MPVAAYAVDVVAIHNWRRDQRVQPVGINFAVACALPHEFRLRAVRQQTVHPRSVVEGRHEQPMVAQHRSGDRQPGLNLERLHPVDRPGLRVERRDGRGMPDDQLARSAGLNQDRRVVAGLGAVVQGPPELFPRDLLEGHNFGVRRAPNQRNKALAND